MKKNLSLVVIAIAFMACKSNSPQVATYAGNGTAGSANGIVTTLAGSGKQGLADGKAASASFFFPVGVAAGPDGSVYVADTHNSLIRKISPQGTVTTIAGALTSSTKDHPDSLQRLDNPYGIVVGKDGTVYFTDWERNMVRKISPEGKMS